ncbi:MAG: hypothetical protein JNL57_03010 [Bacteroidetes bacterium]|nr:hypothetical protein [Bacteroidota bacterium]
MGFSVKNNSISAFTGTWYFRVSKTESTDPLFANNLPEDTVRITANSYKRFYLPDITSYANVMLDSWFYHYAKNKNEFPPGQFKFYISMNELSGALKCADSFTFWMDSISNPVNYYPLCATTLHVNQTPRLHFGYGNADKEQYSGLKYIINLWQRDSAGSDKAFQDSIPFFTDTSYHAYHYKIPQGKVNFSPGKYYYWQVECRSQTWDKVGINDGRSDLFFFTVSDDSFYLTHGFYADSAYEWADNDLMGTPSPPDPDYCRVFTGFENGDLKANAWLGFKGEITSSARRNGEIYSPNANPLYDYLNIFNSGNSTDLGSNAPPNDGRFGNGCAQLGSLSSGMNKNSVSMRKTWTVSNNTQYVKIWYALVSEGPNDHSALQEEYWKKNFFQVKVYNGTAANKNDAIGEPLINHSGLSDRESDCPDYLGTGNSQRKRILWKCRTLDLSAYKNKTVTMDILVASCMPSLTGGGNHKTMAWVDFCVTNGTDPRISTSKTKYCKNEDIIVNSGNSQYFKDYRWEIWQLDTTGTLPERLLYNQDGICYAAPGNPNIKTCLNNNGFFSRCGDRYRIILLTKNDCCDWDTAFKDISITCPPKVNSGPYCCPNWNCSIQLGQPTKAGFTYTWRGAGTSAACLSAINIAQPVFSCGSFNPNCTILNGPLTYWVHVTDSSNCTDSQAVVISSQPANGNITVDTTKCNITLCGSAVANVSAALTYKWHRMGTNALTVSTRCYEYRPLKKDTWMLVVSNGCGNDTVTTIIDKLDRMWGPIDSLKMPVSLCDMGNNDWVVNYLNTSDPNSRYNINEYMISSFTRWGGSNGTRMPLAYGFSNTGFAQGEIKIPKEKLLSNIASGQANLIQLQMKNCDSVFDKLYISNTPFHVTFTKPENCLVCIGQQKVKFIRAWYENHSQGNQNTCYNLQSGGNYCTPSHWSHASVCTSADKNSRIHGALLQKNCICSHKVWSWMYQANCNPANYKSAASVNISRNGNNPGEMLIYFEK